MDGMRVLQIGTAAAGFAAGGAAGWLGLKNVFEKDISGDPVQVRARNGNWVYEQSREPQGQNMTRWAIAAGVGTSGLGAFLSGVSAAAPAITWKSGLKFGGGAFLAAAGVGLIAGSTAATTVYAGTVGRPE